jgi:hypothetical protein
MPEFDLICLANSYKDGGRCVAGLRVDGGGWVRPVSTAAGGPLHRRHFELEDRSEPQLFDVVRIGVERHCPLPHQPENWLIDASRWSLLRRDAGRAYCGLLNNWVARGMDLLGDSRTAISVDEFGRNPASSSLQLIRPRDLHWIVEERENKKKVRAVFWLGFLHYDLPFTDPEFHGVLLRRGMGIHSLSETGIPEDSELLLTVSLTEPFNGHCYKLAAALVILPKQQICFAMNSSHRHLDTKGDV